MHFPTLCCSRSKKVFFWQSFCIMFHNNKLQIIVLSLTLFCGQITNPGMLQRVKYEFFGLKINLQLCTFYLGQFTIFIDLWKGNNILTNCKIKNTFNFFQPVIKRLSQLILHRRRMEVLMLLCFWTSALLFICVGL